MMNPPRIRRRWDVLCEHAKRDLVGRDGISIRERIELIRQARELVARGRREGWVK